MLINFTYLVLDNENYALTTGQASPTTPMGIKTKSTQNGNLSNPFDPVLLAKSAGCGFSYEVDSKNVVELREKINEAISFQGFSHLNMKQSCPSSEGLVGLLLVIPEKSETCLPVGRSILIEK